MPCAKPAHGQQEEIIGLEYFRGNGELWLPKILARPFQKQIPNELSVDDAKEKLAAFAIK